MKKTFLLFAIQLFVGLNAFGQNNEIKKIELSSLSTIGYGMSEFDTISQRLFSDYQLHFLPAVDGTLREFGVKEPKYYPQLFTFQTIDTASIIEICTEEDLEGFLITKIYFLSRGSVYKGLLEIEDLYIPKRYRPGAYDVFVELRLFNSKGELVIESSAKTVAGFGPELTIKNGIKKALKKVK